MKISELSQRASVPVPTIKFYIREGLLPVGARTGRNQADYSQEHLARLSLIRALREDAGLGIGSIAKALRASDAAKEDYVSAAIDAIERPSGVEVDAASADFKRARALVLSLAEERSWRVRPRDNAVDDAARALTMVMRALPDVRDFAVYADVAERLAKQEVPDDWAPAGDRNATLHYAMLGTVLIEPFLLALRRMAHNARSRALAECTMPAVATKRGEGAQTKPPSKPRAAPKARTKR